jgi:TRAP-type C4-dicarboxylate transport system permease small subunit
MLLISRIDNMISQLEQWIVSLLVAAIAGIIMTQVVLRYGFSAPLFWAEEVAALMMVFVTLLGLSLLIRSERVIAIEFLPGLLGNRARHVMAALFGMVIVALLAFIAWLAVTWIQQPQVQLELSSTTRLPRWYSYAALPVLLSFMILHQIVLVLKHASAALGGENA